MPNNIITIRNRQVLLNGQPFQFQGIDYAPTPIGQNPNNWPNGDYFTSDYGDIYSRDLPLMREIGINTIKVYAWNISADHSDFLTKAYNGGTNPIYVLLTSYIEAGNVVGNVNTYTQNYQTLAQNNKDYPAVIGYTVGNELNSEANRSNPAFWSALNKIAGAVKAIDPDHFTTTGLVDDGMLSVQSGDAYMTHLDAWGIDVYRGKSFGNLFTTYEAASSKPLLITELGFPADTHQNGSCVELPDNAQAVADYLSDLWNEFLSNNAFSDPTKAASGIFLFEWTDEWWKGGNNNQQLCNGASTPAFPGGYWDEAWFGINGIAQGSPNILSSRAAFNLFKGLWRS